MDGLLVVISSPSGGGKTSIIQELKKHATIDFEYSISATTRKPRPGEVNGKDYIFLSDAEFLSNIKDGKFIEWEKVHQFYYGTPKQRIEQWLTEGKIVLLDIDVNGAVKIKMKYPQQAVSIFIQPPSVKHLIKRLKNRKTDSAEEINKRLQRLPLELEKKDQFDYIVINNKLQDTVKQVMKIIINYKH